MESVKIQENTKKLIDFVCEKFEKGELNNESLVELFKRTGMYLNLQTKCRKIEEIYGVKFVIDNI